MGRLSKYDVVLQKGNLEVVEVHYYHRLVQVVVRELIGTRMYSIKTDRRKGAGLCAILYTICSFNTKFSTSTLLRAHFLVLYLNRHPRKDACSADTQSTNFWLHGGGVRHRYLGTRLDTRALLLATVKLKCVAPV